MAHDFAQEFYFRMREAATGRLSRDAKRILEKAKTQKSRPFDTGRDPQTAGQTLDGVLKEFRWEAQLAEADLFNRWAELVGQQNADNSQPETLVGGVLTQVNRLGNPVAAHAGDSSRKGHRGTPGSRDKKLETAWSGCAKLEEGTKVCSWPRSERYLRVDTNTPSGLWITC